MKNLKIARIRADLKQHELAQSIGVSETMIAQYEQGRSKPRVETLIALSKKLNVTTDFLLGLED